MPSEFDWTWSGSTLGVTMLVDRKCGAHSLPNGNFVICETSLGQVTEVTKSGDHLWTYRNPSGLNGIANQYDQIDDDKMFGGENYFPEFPGFDFVDISSQGLVEDKNPMSNSCVNVAVNEVDDIV